MTTEQTQQKKKYDKFKLCYGAIYRGFLENQGAEKFVITNLRVREWLGPLSYFKKKQYIVDFKLGDSIETACDLGIVGFNLDNVDDEQYINYGKGVKKNFEKEQTPEEQVA